MIDKELEMYYGAIKELCNSTGYKILCQDYTEQALSINSIELTKDEADLNFRKGQLNVINHFLSLEQQITALEEQLEDGDSYAENL